MKSHFLFILVFILNFLLVAKPKVITATQNRGEPLFFSEITRSFAEEKGKFKLNTFLKISNSRLFFIKENQNYKARYFVNIAIFAEDEEIPFVQKNLRKEILTSNYNETLARDIEHSINETFLLPEGEYSVRINLTDQNSNTLFPITKNLSYFERKKHAVTNPLLVKIPFKNFNKDSLFPIVTNTISENENAGLFFEILGEKAEEYQIKYQVIESKTKQIIHQNSYSRTMQRRISYELFKMGLKNLESGKYKVQLEIKIGDKNFTREKEFYVKIKDITSRIGNLSKAISKMIYIAPADTLEYTLKKDLNYQKRWFKNFWKKAGKNKNLNPDLLIEEYFWRVNYSDIHFSLMKKDGWKTDRGQVFCVMGEPDEIKNNDFIHSSNSNREAEIWIYYNKNLTFIFEYIGGEYRLKTR